MRLTTLEDIDPPFVGIQNVRKAILTASGGAFRTWTKDKIEKATPEDALKHPTWAMGAKVTVDSASLMNKGLELIEAHWLFGLPASKLDVLVHPQSIVHAIAEFDDGSSVAQLAPPDMRLPIQRALTWPLHVDGVSRRMSWRDMTSLEFSQVDRERFPSLGLAYEVLRMGGTSGAVLNAANEEAVGAFLRGGRGEGAPMPFGRIHDLVADALACVPIRQMRSLGDVQEAETLAREHVRRRLASRSG